MKIKFKLPINIGAKLSMMSMKQFAAPISVGDKLGVSELKQIGDDLDWQITYLGVDKERFQICKLKHILNDKEYFQICEYLRKQKGVLYCLINDEIKTFDIDLQVLNENAILDLYNLDGMYYFLSENVIFEDKKKPQSVLISHFENENIGIEMNETRDVYHISNFQ